MLFTDIVGSTALAAAVGDRRWRDLLERHDAAVDGELRRENGRRVKHTGDGVLATFDGPAKAVRCAHAVIERGRHLGFDVRAGVHTGECHRRGDDLSGIAVHIGARVGALAGAGEVLVSQDRRGPRRRFRTPIRGPGRARAEGPRRPVAALRPGRHQATV